MVAALAPTAAPRAAIYVRVSSQQQEREGTSLETQEAACRRFCAERGYELAEDIYREVYSGQSLWERRALSRLRDAVRRGDVDVIVCYSVDRLARDAVHLGVIITEAEHAGCAVEFVSEPLDDTPEGQLVRFIKGFAAKVEAEKIRERTGRGRRARVEAGKPLASGKARYGYLWRDDEKTGMELDPIAAPVVRRIFDLALIGMPLRSIASTLNDEGVRSPSGKGRWNHTAIRAILGDPLFAGLGGGLRWQMVKVRSPRTGNLYRRCVRRPIDEQIPFPEGTVPAIVTTEEFEIVQDRLERNKIESPRRMRNPEAALLEILPELAPHGKVKIG
jgi:site-specific DNA recombinase